MARRLGRWGIGVVLVGGIVLFTGNGWTDPWLWAYVLTLALVSLYALASIDDDLAKERFNPPEPGADRLPLRFVRLIALGHLIVGALTGPPSFDDRASCPSSDWIHRHGRVVLRGLSRDAVEPLFLRGRAHPA